MSMPTKIVVATLGVSITLALAFVANLYLVGQAA